MNSKSYQKLLNEVENLPASAKAKMLLGREYVAWLPDPSLVQALAWAEENVPMSREEANATERMLQATRQLQMRQRPDLAVRALFDPDEGTPAEIAGAETLHDLARGVVSLAAQALLSPETLGRAQRSA